MNPELDAFFYEQVFMVYKEYLNIKENHEMGLQKDKQAAIHACYALYHFREHLPFVVSNDQLTAKCNDYSLVRDVANVSKHAETLRYTPKVKSIEEVLVVSSFSDAIGNYSNTEKIVEITLVDGSRRDLCEVMANVTNMWYAVLTEKGVSDYRIPISYVGSKIVNRSEAKNMDFKTVQGLRWNQKMRIQNYNEENDTFEPVNLSDVKDIKFRVFKSPS